MHRLRKTDGGQVSVSLIAHHQVIRGHAFKSGGNGSGSSVRRTDKIEVKVELREVCAADCYNTD